MEKAERDAILRQGIVLPETPRDRSERAGLEADLATSPLRGRELSVRLLNFRPSADAYLAAARGPLVYMLRLRAIETATAEHEAELGERWRALAQELAPHAERFAERWRELASAWDFGEVNDLVERHNRWYPVESRLAMDPRTGDFVRVNGRDYRLPPLDGAWVLERFPARLELALPAAA